jgi:3-methyladenine DNA glycosylase AlkD
MDIINKLFELQDIGYGAFHARLNPNIDKDLIIGVRFPDLKKLEKSLSKDEKEEFISKLPHKYCEENNLHGLIMGSISNDISKTFNYLDIFIPYIDNWATCDTTVSGLKIFKRYPKEVHNKVNEWLKSENPFIVRFGIVILLGYFLNDNFDLEDLKTLSSINSDNYYVNMALAWYFSVALVKQYDSTIKLIEAKSLPKFVHNKSIQKAIESYRISPSSKEYLRSLKVK